MEAKKQGDSKFGYACFFYYVWRRYGYTTQLDYTTQLES